MLMGLSLLSCVNIVWRCPGTRGHPDDHGGQHRDERDQHHSGAHAGRGEGAVQAYYTTTQLEVINGLMVIL